MCVVTVKKMMEDNELVLLAGRGGLERKIEKNELSRPGVELMGFFDFFDPSRIVLIGTKEATIFKTKFDEKEQKTSAKTLFDKEPPAFVFSKNIDIPDIFITYGDKYNIPILKSDLGTTATSSKLFGYLQSFLAPKKSLHGVLLDISGVGVLITGKSAIGKSEIALELLRRGHRLVSDDRVEIYEQAVGTIVGTAPKILRRYMEIRGMGIVDVVEMFGAGAYRESKKIRLVVELERWESGKTYERIGVINKTISYFNTKIPIIVLPVSPGRNVSVLIESAALNSRLRHMGINAAKRFTNSLKKEIKKGDDD